MVYGVILAAGIGSRMKTKDKKQFIKINGKEVVDYSIEKFLSIKSIGTIIIVLNENDKNNPSVNKIIRKYKNEIYNSKICLIIGGKERYDSVYNALNFIYDNYYIKKDDKIIIHDSARPNVDEKDIKKLISCLKKYKVVTLASRLIDTIKKIDTSKTYNQNIYMVDKTVDRDEYFLIKTPQGFNLRLLIDCYDKFYLYLHKLSNKKSRNTNSINKNNKKTKLSITDDLQIIENFSKEKTYVLDSNILNYKITTKDDLKLLQYLL